MQDEVAGVHAKLKRADVHLRDLDGLVCEFLETNPYEFSGEEWIDADTEYRHQRLYLEIRRAPDDSVWGR
jgi:hypothetical protein